MELQTLLRLAEENKASDLHLVAGECPILRIDGKLQRINSEEKLTGKIIEEMILSLLSVPQKKEFMEKREYDLSFQAPDGGRFRINVFFEKGSMSMAARVIPKNIPTFEELNLDQKFITSLLLKPHGLILVTGPSGSGKSSALASMVNEINATRAVNIITLEDPIEFVFTPKESIVRQREFGKDFLSFPEGLKHALRQDPNVIMVGEMRDPETIATTLTLAETGHLIFATLHTYNASQTMDRIVGSFPPYQQDQIRTQLSLSLVAVLSQRLLDRVDGGRRIAAREILMNTTAVGNLIRENKLEQIPSIIQTSREDGMITMESAIGNLVAQNIVSEEEASRHLPKNHRDQKEKSKKSWR